MDISTSGSHLKRHLRTVKFINEHLSKEDKILDLGITNSLSKMIKEAGFQIQNTQGEDLDFDYHAYQEKDINVLTAFQIFEHMFAPYNILKETQAKKLIASVPLKLWFSSAYWGDDDRDKHYHEFEKKQFDFLLEKTGWKIVASETWTNGKWNKVGIRPLLRHFTPRHYIVYCERI